MTVKPWNQLYQYDKEPYYQWVVTLVDIGTLNLETDQQIEDKARRMYEVDNGLPITQTTDSDPFKNLNIDFKPY